MYQFVRIIYFFVVRFVDFYKNTMRHTELLAWLLAACCMVSVSKTVQDQYSIRRLMMERHRFMFLSKFDFGIGKSKININIKQPSSTTEFGPRSPQTELPQLKVGILLDQKYQDFNTKQTCEQKQSLLANKQSITLPSEPYEVPMVFNIEQNIREHIWYIYAYQCNQKIFEQEKDNAFLKLHTKIVMLNKGDSHFGQDEGIVIWVYVLALPISLFLLPHNVRKLRNKWSEGESDYAHFFVTTSIFLLALGYTLKIIHLVSYSNNGVGSGLVDVLSILCISSSDSAITILLVVIAWGWTVTYINGEYDELYIPMGCMLGIVNVVCSGVGKATDQFQDKNHHFDAVTGWIVLSVRTGLTAIFSVGIVKTWREAKPKTRQFIRQFGILGFIYLAGHPFAVLFCQLVFPAYMQNEWILALMQLSHASASAFLTYMITSSKSAYHNLEYNQRTVFTPIGDKVF